MRRCRYRDMFFINSIEVFDCSEEKSRNRNAFEFHILIYLNLICMRGGGQCFHSSSRSSLSQGNKLRMELWELFEQGRRRNLLTRRTAQPADFLINNDVKAYDFIMRMRSSLERMKRMVSMLYVVKSDCEFKAYNTKPKVVTGLQILNDFETKKEIT